jgi:hypothetical protein
MVLEPETAGTNAIGGLAPSTSTLKPLAAGTLATLAMLGIYFGVLTLGV